MNPPPGPDGRLLVAVTGATGFTGGALTTRLLDEGYRVRVLARKGHSLQAHDNLELVNGDLSDAAALGRLVEGADTVFHVAAMYRTEGSYDEFLAVNHQGTKALLDAAVSAGVRRFVHCSTIGVHGHVANGCADETAPLAPRDAYQQTKLMAEESCRAAMAEGRIEVVIIRPCAIYGPGDTRMLKIFSMVQKGVFLFVGDGKPNFHAVYVDDLVSAFLLAMTVPEAAGEAFIVGGRRYVPLTDYVGAISRAIGASAPTRRIPYAPMYWLAYACELICAPLRIQPPLHRRRLSFFKHNRAFSIEKARRILGYQPRVELEDGLRRTAEWYYETGLLTRPPGRQ